MPPHRVGILRRFGLKTGIHFAHFSLESQRKLFPDSQRRKSKEHKLKHLLKAQASFIICFHSGNLLERLSPFYTSPMQGTNIFFFKKRTLPTLIFWGSFTFSLLNLLSNRLLYPYCLPALTQTLTFKLKLLVMRLSMTAVSKLNLLT